VSEAVSRCVSNSADAALRWQPVAHASAATRATGALERVPSGGLVLGAIASVQFGAAIAATLFGEIGPDGAVFLRLASGALILVVVWRPRLRGHGRRELMLAGLFGLVLGGMNLSFYEALHRIPLGIAVAVEFVGPLGVAVAGSRRRLDVLWIVLAAGGIAALTHGGAHATDATGIALALLAGVLWAAYIIVNARVGRTFEGTTGLVLAMCVAAVVATPLGVASAGTHLLEPRSLALGAAVGLLSSAIPYTFELEALRRLPPSTFGILMSLEPAVAALAGFVVLGQGLGARAVGGMALVVIASVGVTRRAREAPVAV
jgi:inner membrane transporter RhtA